MTSKEVEDLYNLLKGFIFSAIKMKSLPRQGWIRVGIPLSDVESIADHSYNTAMLSLMLVDIHNILYPDRPLKSDLVMRLAIIHDLPECMYQDLDHQVHILLGQDLYNEVKRKILVSASEELLQLILNEDVKKQWKEMFDDMANKNSEEARFVNYVDKLELLIQALSYENLGYSGNLFDPFWQTSKEFLKNCDFEVINDLIPLIESERKSNNA